MPRRPSGGETPRDPIEAGLRSLALGPGPAVTTLLDARNDANAIMRLVKPPASWKPEEAGEALLGLIAKLPDDLVNPRWRAAAEASLRVPAERFAGLAFDSLARRWQERALEYPELINADPAKREETFRGYWRTAAKHLAAALVRRIEMQNVEGWSRTTVNSGPLAPPLDLPISFRSTEVLYQFDGYRGVQSTSRRIIVAHGDVSHYEAVGWYYSEPDAPVEILPVANCQLDGGLQDLPQGGRSGTLRFDHLLHDGDELYFEYVVRFNSQKKCRPTILYEVRARAMELLVVRAQFDPEALPIKVWHFDVIAQTEGSKVPDEGARELLMVGTNGFVEKKFGPCLRGRKYGLRWLWPNGD